MAAVSGSHVSLIPAHRLDEDWWRERFDSTKAALTSDPKILFVGDSITQGWEDVSRPTWERLFSPLGAANLGFSGDRTEHVLWRLEHGGLERSRAKLVVLMIGTNNVGHLTASASETAEGVRAVVWKLLEKLPSARILLLGILPRGAGPEDPMRVAAEEATDGFRELHDGEKVFFFESGRSFVRKDGAIRSDLLPDHLHLTPEAYEIWGEEIAPEIRRLLPDSCP